MASKKASEKQLIGSIKSASARILLSRSTEIFQRYYTLQRELTFLVMTLLNYLKYKQKLTDHASVSLELRSAGTSGLHNDMSYVTLQTGQQIRFLQIHNSGLSKGVGNKWDNWDFTSSNIIVCISGRCYENMWVASEHSLDILPPLSSWPRSSSAGSKQSWSILIIWGFVKNKSHQSQWKLRKWQNGKDQILGD